MHLQGKHIAILLKSYTRTLVLVSLLPVSGAGPG